MTPNRGMGPREALFVKLLRPLVNVCVAHFSLLFYTEQNTLQACAEIVAEFSRKLVVSRVFVPCRVFFRSWKNWI